MADLRRFIDGYDCGIRYMDDHIGQLFAALEQAGVMDDLAIIISSDHGENLGELGLYGEHGTADNITCRIPLIIRWPGGAQGSVDKGLHYNLDLGPTLAELLGRPAKPHWDGESFAPTITRRADRGREYLVISQGCHVCQRSVRWGDWLYMRTYHDGYHLFPAEMLYNLADDPHEQHDLAAARPDLCAQGLRYLTEWHDQMMATMPAGSYRRSDAHRPGRRRAVPRQGLLEGLCQTPGGNGAGGCGGGVEAAASEGVCRVEPAAVLTTSAMTAELVKRRICPRSPIARSSRRDARPHAARPQPGTARRVAAA